MGKNIGDENDARPTSTTYTPLGVSGCVQERRGPIAQGTKAFSPKIENREKSFSHDHAQEPFDKIPSIRAD